jgi:uncharacterized protein YjiS (DUF1127 family)
VENADASAGRVASDRRAGGGSRRIKRAEAADMNPVPSDPPSAYPHTASKVASPREGALARALRWARDRRSLLELDGRLLRDVGLARGDVERGLPFAAPADNRTYRPAAALGSDLRQIGRLDARGWHVKLYAPRDGTAGLRQEDLAAARRAFRAVVAEPRPVPTSGFALLRWLRTGEAWAGPGALTLASYWWEGADLHRSSLLLAGDGGGLRRAPDRAGRLGCIAEIGLFARECQAWRDKVLEAAVPSIDAYLAECCA